MRTPLLNVPSLKFEALTSGSTSSLFLLVMPCRCRVGCSGLTADRQGSEMGLEIQEFVPLLTFQVQAGSKLQNHVIGAESAMPLARVSREGDFTATSSRRPATLLSVLRKFREKRFVAWKKIGTRLELCRGSGAAYPCLRVPDFISIESNWGSWGNRSQICQRTGLT